MSKSNKILSFIKETIILILRVLKPFFYMLLTMLSLINVLSFFYVYGLISLKNFDFLIYIIILTFVPIGIAAVMITEMSQNKKINKFFEKKIKIKIGRASCRERV